MRLRWIANMDAHVGKLIHVGLLHNRQEPLWDRQPGARVGPFSKTLKSFSVVIFCLFLRGPSGYRLPIFG